MNRFIDNWMRGVKRRRKLINRCLLLFFTIAIATACGSTTTNQNQPSDSQTALSDCRRVQHELGAVCVPLAPQRVVILGNGLDTVLSLGVKPVGSTDLNQENYSYLENEMAGIANLGNTSSPNLEAILALKPDLILGLNNHHKKNYELLSQIAPTVLHKWEDNDPWKALLNHYAEVLGRADKAEQLLGDYYARIEKFQAEMGARLQQTEVSIVNVFDDRIWVYLEDSHCGVVVADAGFPRPDYQTELEKTFNISISKELLHKADADVIFVWTFGADEEKAQESQTAWQELKSDPLWLKLNAVQQGKVYEVPSRWVSMGPMAANLVLDDLFKYLVQEKEQ